MSLHEHRVARGRSRPSARSARAGASGTLKNEREGEHDGPHGRADRDQPVGQAVGDVEPEPVDALSDDDENEGEDAADVAEPPSETAHAADGARGRDLDEHRVVVDAGDLGDDGAEGDEDRAVPEEHRVGVDEEERELHEREQRSCRRGPSASCCRATSARWPSTGASSRIRMPAAKVTQPYHSARSARPLQYRSRRRRVREQTRLSSAFCAATAGRQEAVGDEVERHEDEGQDDGVEGLRRPVPHRPGDDLLARAPGVASAADAHRRRCSAPVRAWNEASRASSCRSRYGPSVNGGWRRAARRALRRTRQATAAQQARAARRWALGLRRAASGAMMDACQPTSSAPNCPASASVMTS